VIGIVAMLGAISAPSAKHLLAHGDDMRITFPRPVDTPVATVKTRSIAATSGSTPKP